ncbi:MAG: hypothetical protein PHY12_08240 [Eubacteriales bacterium]|nr:hypothetical protein [Eubacteriales bacterium]
MTYVAGDDLDAGEYTVYSAASIVSVLAEGQQSDHAIADFDTPLTGLVLQMGDEITVSDNACVFVPASSHVTSSAAQTYLESLEETQTETMVWVPTKGGTKYHSSETCSNMKEPRSIPLSQAEAEGFTPCKRCH